MDRSVLPAAQDHGVAATVTIAISAVTKAVVEEIVPELLGAVLTTADTLVVGHLFANAHSHSKRKRPIRNSDRPL